MGSYTLRPLPTTMITRMNDYTLLYETSYVPLDYMNDFSHMSYHMSPKITSMGKTLATLIT